MLLWAEQEYAHKATTKKWVKAFLRTVASLSTSGNPRKTLTPC